MAGGVCLRLAAQQRGIESQVSSCLAFPFQTLAGYQHGQGRIKLSAQVTHCPPTEQNSYHAGQLSLLPHPYGQIQFKVQSTLPETVTEVKKAEQE